MARRTAVRRIEVPDGGRVVAFYIRVSSDKQARKGMGLEAQLAGIERDWYLRGPESPDKDLTVRVYRDEGAPGWMGWTERPVSGDLYRDAVAGRVARVVIFSPDRASRDTKDSLDMLDKFADLDVVVEFVTLPNLTNSPAHRLSLIQAFSVAEYEGRTIGARSIASKRVRWAAGKHAIKPPFGYHRPGGELAIDPVQAEAVRRMAAMFLEGVTVREIVRRLDADKVATVKGGPWTRAAVRQILANPVYTGTYVVNREQVLKKYTAEGRRGQTVVRIKRRIVPDAERYTLTVPAILDAATHRAIKSRLADNAATFHASKGAHHHGAPGRADGPFSLLRGGVLFCLECERAGVTKDIPVYASTRGGRSPRYRCSSRDRHNGAGPCAASWDLAHVDRVTREAFADHVAKDAETHLLIEARRQRSHDAGKVLTLTRTVAALKDKQNRVFDMFAEGLYDKAERDRRLRPVVADLAAAHAALAAATVPVANLDYVRAWGADTRAALLADDSAEHVATMIRTVCRKVRIGRDEILLDLVPDRLIPRPPDSDTTGRGIARRVADSCPKGEMPSRRKNTFRTEVTPRLSSTPALDGAPSRVITIRVALPPVPAPRFTPDTARAAVRVREARRVTEP